MIAKMLNPSCVRLESSGQHNISTSAPSGHGKVVKFERVFPGVFLHHLFMHMNLFSPPPVAAIGFAQFGSLQMVL